MDSGVPRWKQTAANRPAICAARRGNQANLSSEAARDPLLRRLPSRTLCGKGRRTMRSKLFVPGSRPELFAKALAGDADSISFDVEDSVPENSKAYAREQIADFLRSSAAGESAKATAKLMIV